MRNIRFLVVAISAAVLALAGFATAPTSAAPPPRDGATLQWSKTMKPGTARAGDVVTVKLTVRNTGSLAARDVVGTDPLPTGLEYVNGDSGCSASGSTVTCAFPDVAPNGGSATKSFRVRVTSTGYPDADQHRHQLRINKAEQFVSLPAGSQRDVIVRCGDGNVATDGSALIQAVDQGTGTLDDVKVIEQYAFATDSYYFTLRNNASGQAQVKLFVMCVGDTTTAAGPGSHVHRLTTQSLAFSNLDFAAGTYTLETPSCAGGKTSIAPGYRLLGNVATPAPDGELLAIERVGDRFRLTIKIDGPAASIQTHTGCLPGRSTIDQGHRHTLDTQLITKRVTVPARSTIDASLVCADGSKGITAGYRTSDFGVDHDGNEPQPVSRVFRLRNTTNYPDAVDLSLLCLADRTGEAGASIINKATVTTSTPYQSSPPSAAVAVLDVVPGPPASPAPAVKPKNAKLANRKMKVKVACQGDARCTGKVIVKARGKRLGAKRFTIGSDKRRAVKMKLRNKKLRIARNTKFVQVKVKVRGGKNAKRKMRLR